MKNKKILTMSIALLITLGVTNQVTAIANETYVANVQTSVHDPLVEIEEVDPNEALSGGMSRSTTGEFAKIELTDNGYQVTVRLLMQSSAQDVTLWQFDGQEYQALEYEITGQSEQEDSIDYQFETTDPYAPIKAEMFVIPMGRTTEWFMELDEQSTTSDLGIFDIDIVETEPEIEVEIERESEIEQEVEPTQNQEETSSNTTMIIAVSLGVIFLVAVGILIKKR